MSGICGNAQTTSRAPSVCLSQEYQEYILPQKLTTETVLSNTENELSLLCLCHSAFIQLFAVGVVGSACRLLPANLGQMTDNRVFYCRPINAIQNRQKQPGSK
jgi:hypothetical protein